jgi:L-iditol 2-dehydrogenase
MSVFSATTGGKVSLIGMGTRAAYLPLSTAALREIDILGSFRYCDTYPAALALLAAGTMPMVSTLITHRFRLEDTRNAFDVMSRGIDEQGGLVLKVMVGTGVAC